MRDMTRTGRWARGARPGAGRLRRVVGELLVGTAGRLRLVGLVATLTCLGVGACLAVTLVSTMTAAAAARADAAQVVRIEEVTADLLRADAAATNAYLMAGAEPADQRRRYDEAMASASRLVTEAAAAQPADATALALIGQRLTGYLGLVEHARADNRQGLVVGAQYQRQASQDLRAGILPVLEAITVADQARAAAQLDWPRRQARLGLVAGVAGLVGLVLVSTWLARRTRRLINVGLAGAVGCLLVAGGAAALGQAAAGSQAAAVQTRFELASTLAATRAAAYDARANESLTLIARGSGDQFEQRWQTSMQRVEDGFRSVGLDRSTLDAYRALHTELRAADDGGHWDEAVTLAVTRPEFDVLDAALSAALADSSAAVADVPDAWVPAVAAWVCAALGVLGGYAVVRGVGRRLEDYR